MIYKKSLLKPRKNYPILRGSREAIIFPAFFQAKFDGELTWLYINKMNPGIGLETYLVNKYGSVRYNSKQLRMTESRFKEDSGIFLGELIFGNGLRGDEYKLTANKDSESLRFLAFDVIEYNSQDVTRQSLLERLEVLSSLQGKLDFTKTKVVNDQSEIDHHFEEVTKIGFEGGIVKNFNEPFPMGPCSWVKIKKKDRSNFPIYKIDPVRERLEVLVNLIKPVTVGVKCCNKDKKGLNPADLITIEYQGVTKSGSLRNPVFIGKV